ncbi:MAG: 6-hydroxymethylpterin diphosphokinase MptE-like protein [Thermoplasmata archaeon]
MEWKDWKPWYERIIADLGFDPARDIEAAGLLGRLLEKRSGEARLLEDLICGREAVVLGPAPLSDMHFDDAILISAGSAAEQLLVKGIMPDIVVTDLDGNVRAQVMAQRSGALVVVHAHGDNMPALREWVPRFRPPIIGTTQAEPFGLIHNFGGFTDGDRAVFMAMNFGASRIILRGFDFARPVGKPSADMDLKRKKLGYARQLIEHAKKTSSIEIVA